MSAAIYSLLAVCTAFYSCTIPADVVQNVHTKFEISDQIWISNGKGCAINIYSATIKIPVTKPIEINNFARIEEVKSEHINVGLDGKNCVTNDKTKWLLTDLLSSKNVVFWYNEEFKILIVFENNQKLLTIMRGN